MVAMRVMEMTTDPIVYVITVRHRLMAATRAVHMA
jgi:hypothetical protein